MTTRHSYSYLQPFLDVLFNVLMVLMVLVVLSMPLQIIKKETLVKKAEYIVQIQWNNDSSDDIDLWFRSPEGYVVYYGNKQRGIYYLERDDLGHINDTIIRPDGSKEVVYNNQETLTIRGSPPGTYSMTVFFYKKRTKADYSNTVVLELIQLNPYKLIHQKVVTLDTAGQEINMGNFSIDGTGKVVDVFEEDILIFNGAD